MRWPWSKPEKREAGGDFTQTIVQFAEAQAAGTAADAGRTAAVEAAAGLLSRSFQGAHVDAPSWVQDMVTPDVLAQVGRDLIRQGEYLAAIRMGGTGDIHLITCSDFWWHEGDAHRSTWWVRATAYGPSTSHTWYLPDDSVVFVKWGSNPGSMYRGQSPIAWASVSSRLSAAAERSLADEAGGPLAQLLPIPQDGGDDEDDDPLASLKSDIKSARGKALLVETTAAGWHEGKMAAPTRDWTAARLGPSPPAAMVEVADQAFERVLASCGMSRALFDDSDGTSKREALRQFHLGVVVPLARHVQFELSMKLGERVRLVFDGYAKDMVSRGQVFKALMSAEGVNVDMAMKLAGLIEGEE